MSLTSTYARAFYETAREEAKNGKPTAINLTQERKEIQGLIDLLEKSKEARVALWGPATSTKEKIAVVEAICEKAKVSSLVKRFLVLLAQKGRLSHLAGILHSLDEVRLEAEGGVLGEVFTADPLKEGDLKALSESFEKKLGKKVEFRVSTDPKLLAGLKVTVGGVTYDGTLRSQLERLRENFIQEGGETLH